MGLLAKALAPPSSYAAKKTDLWSTLMTDLTDCVMPRDVDALEERIAAMDLQIPNAWKEPLEEVIAKRREEIAQEEVGAILREKYDF